MILKITLVIVLACLLCLGLSSCGESDKFVGVWEGRMGPDRLVSSSRIPVLARITRSGTENRYYVQTMVKTEKIPINPVFPKVMILSNVTAVLDGERLKFEDGSTAEIDAETGRLHMGGIVFTKTDYTIEII